MVRAAQLEVEFNTSGIEAVTRDVDGLSGRIQNASGNINAWGKGLLGFGALITGAFTAPILAGSKAAWGQVDAVEQATVAMRAYSDSAEEVDAVLAGLIEYARSDMGVLFQRQDLFDAAQSMLMYGAAIEDVQGYVETLSLSVGLGLSNWDDLNRVIGRVGSTGRLTGNDFDYLRAAGFELDDSLRNTNITWEELFAHLEKGIPADALAGQADTIRGKTIRLQSALRGLGLAFLGVDSETSKFIKGGLGWQMMRGMERLTELMKAAAPAVGRLGDVFAAIGRPLGQAFDLLLRLPQPVQTAALLFTAATGATSLFAGGLLLMLPRIASTVDAFKRLTDSKDGVSLLTKAVGGLRTAMLGLFTNPAVLAGIAIIGAGILAYKTNFLGFGDLVKEITSLVGDLFAALQLVFGSPITNTATLDIGTVESAAYSDWVLMEDGTYKNAELGLTATGDGVGIVSWVANPDSPDGKDWTLSVDVDGDGKDDALEIIRSEKDAEDNYRLTAEYIDENGEVQTFIAWYDENDGKTIFLDMDAAEAVQEISNVEQAAGRVVKMAEFIEKAWDDVRFAIFLVTGGVQVLINVFNKVAPALQWVYDFIDPFSTLRTHIETLHNIITGDWGSISWEDVMDSAGLGLVYDAVVLLTDAYNTLMDAWNNWTNRGGESTGPDYANTVDTDMGPQPTMSGPTRTPWQPGAQSTQYDRDNSPAFSGLRAGADFGAMLNDAVSASKMFSGTLQSLNPEILRANDNFGKTASTVPMYTSATREADSATGAMAGNMGTSFGRIASSALASFGTMQAEASGKSSAMERLVTANTASMQSGVLANMLGMRTAAALQMGLMASSAKTSGSQMNTGLTGWMTGALARIAATMASMVSTVRNAAGSGYNAGYYAGSQISLGFANGMSAYLPEIRASANAMVAAASQAVIAKAMISSPSRLFMQYGEYIGEGLEIGMRRMIPSIDRAADAMIPVPAFNAPIGGRSGYGTTVIDNSTHEEFYITLNDAQFAELLAAKDKANAVHAVMTDRNAGSQYRRGGR